MISRTLFSDEHEMFRKTVRRFIETEITPHHAQWERDGMVSRDAWRKAGDARLLCTAIPEAYGGVGGDFLHSVVVLEELARAGASGPGFNLHSDIIAPYIDHYGTEAQKHRWLPPMARGEAIAAIGMTEPSGGSDLQSIRTTARRDGNEYVINGQKVFISNGQLCDVLVLAAKTSPHEGARGISLILVEATRPGFTKGRNLEKVGFKAQDTSELFFSDVRVPVENLLGGEGRGFAQLMTELPQERLIQAVRAVSVCEAALEWTVGHVRERTTFGKPLAAHQNTQFKLAEMKAQITAARVFVDRCIAVHLARELDAVDAAIAKMTATELQGRVLDECVQLFGGYGYMWEYPIARAWADARHARISGGSVEMMKYIIGRSVVGKIDGRPDLDR
jgi:long-chain-acyl-CoA dehydrogenase